MRLSDIARCIAPYLNKDVAGVHAALRNPHIKTHLEGVAGPTSKSPVDYAEIEVVRAFALLAAQASNVDGVELGRINAALNECNAALMDSAGGTVPSGLVEMVRSVRAGHTDWHLFVRFILPVEGARVISARLGRDEMKVTAQRASNAERILRGEITVGHMFIPLGALIAPLVVKA